MRIRKRLPPPPSQPSVSVGASSESPGLQHDFPCDAPNHNKSLSKQEENRYRPDLQLVNFRETNGDEGEDERKKKQMEGNDCMRRAHNNQESPDGVEEEAVAEEKQFGSSNLRKWSNINGAAAAAAAAATSVGNLVSSSTSSHHQVIGRWGEGEKAIPLKKRRESFEGIKVINKNEMIKKKKGRVESKKNKMMIMEGSRCSRVNGRGWRCCQQTLVGYSLCEHHLGKGRLRSINPKKEEATGLSLSSASPELQKALPEEEEEEDDDQKPLKIIATKRKKIGMVKARSISSLLSQSTLHAQAVTHNHLLKL